MSKFTVEEINLICIYHTGSREDLISELSKMQTHLQKDETELLGLTYSVIDKLNSMKDDEFEDVIVELVADFDQVFVV